MKYNPIDHGDGSFSPRWICDSCGQNFAPKVSRSDVLRLASPWSLLVIVERLRDAAAHLLQDHNCDIHGHEGIREAKIAADEWLEEMKRG